MRPGSALLLLGLALDACSPHIDLVATRAPGALCTDTGTCPVCEPGGTCATDPRCAGDPACEVTMPPPPPDMCTDHTCASAATQGTFCASDGRTLALGDGCAKAAPTFRFALCSKSEIVTMAPLQIKGDIAIDGQSADFGDATTIDGRLQYSGKLEASGPPPQAAAIEKSDPTCGQGHVTPLDIAQTVRTRATDNDNVALAETLKALEHFTGDRDVSLPCGRYYLRGIWSDGALTLRALGHVALFVDGPVQLARGLKIEAPAPARVSLIVNGAVHVQGGFSLGETSRPEHLLCAAGQVHMEDGESTLAGTLYLPEYELLTSSPLHIVGAAFVGRATLNGSTAIEYAPTEAAAAGSCDAR